MLRTIELVRVNNPVLDAAAALEPADLRSLDVIHLATAQLFGKDLGVVVTYDERMIAAAEKLGLPANSPC